MYCVYSGVKLGWGYIFSIFLVLIVHPSIDSLSILLILNRVTGQSQLALNGRRGTPWTSRQSVTGPTYTQTDNHIYEHFRVTDQPNLHVFGENARRTCKLHTEGPQSASEFEPRTLLL